MSGEVTGELKNTMYLIDTNIWLERLLEQEKTELAQKFLDKTPSDQLFLSDFTFHSLGVILTRIGENETFIQLTNDLFIEGNVHLKRILPEDMKEVTNAISHFGLDFDDAYQYVLAYKHNLTLVTFDKDFDKTDISNQSPAQLI